MHACWGLLQQLNENESRNSFRSSVLSRRVCMYEKDNFVFARVSALFPSPTHLLRSQKQ